MIQYYNYSSLNEDTAQAAIHYIAAHGTLSPDNPSKQTKSTLFLAPELNPYRDSFVDACRKYLRDPQLDIERAHCWAHIANKLDYHNIPQRDLWHTHPADISGILYLTTPTTPTEYIDENGTIQQTQVNPHTWCIYPSQLVHRCAHIISDSTRYVLAADCYIRA